MSVGPNVKKLAIYKMSVEAIPFGCGNGLAAGIAFLTDRDRMIRTDRESQEWAMVAVAMVRQAPGENPWRDADDEAIAAEILRQIEERKERQKRIRGSAR